MERNKDLLVNVLLDKTRGTRGQQNSATLLSPLLHQVAMRLAATTAAQLIIAYISFHDWHALAYSMATR